MIQTTLASVALIVIGWCLYVRRRSWPMRWDAVLTLAVVLQGIGFVLSMPAQGRWLGEVLFRSTGISHIRDLIAHICFISASSAVVYGVALRVAPGAQLERLMRKIELPSATAALTMLFCLISSRSLRRRTAQDFFQVPCDGWLTLYWLTYMGICAYILSYLVRLLLVLRRDSRSRMAANAYIGGVGIGYVAIVAQVIHVLAPRDHVSYLWMWLPLTVASVLAATGSAWSWRRRMLRQAVR